MANRAGLKKVVKTVRGKHGAVRRSYWVRAQEAGKSLIRKHGGKIAAVAVTAGLMAAANYFGDRNHGASRRAAVGSAASTVASGAHRAGSAVAGGVGRGLNAVVGAGRSVGSAISNSNVAQNLAYHTSGRMQRSQNSSFQMAQAGSMAWGGRSFNQAANFTASRNHGFSGDTLHVGGNVGSSLSAAHASQYNGSQHVGIRHSGDSAYSTGVTQAVRGYGPVPRRAGPLARRFGS